MHFPEHFVSDFCACGMLWRLNFNTSPRCWDSWDDWDSGIHIPTVTIPTPTNHPLCFWWIITFRGPKLNKNMTNNNVTDKFIFKWVKVSYNLLHSSVVSKPLPWEEWSPDHGPSTVMVCDSIFSHKNNIYVHQKSKHDGLSYDFHQCGGCFSSNGYLTKPFTSNPRGLMVLLDTFRQGHKEMGWSP